MVVARRSRLGSNAKTVSTSPKQPFSNEDASTLRLRRFALQSTAAKLLPHERVAHCLRRRIPVSQQVEVQYVPDTHSAHYRGLQTCASVWQCPTCAAKISERRRMELSKLIDKHIAAGGSVYMTTYTISHHAYHDLRDLLSRFLAARRKMRQGRRGQALRHDFGVIGTVSVLEVTWSKENGWHPHVHELVFCKWDRLDETRYEQTARTAWEDAATAYALKMNAHGFKLDRTYGAVQDYIAKFGREPLSEHPWGVDAEMVKGHLKQARVHKHYTPFALLAAIHDEGRTELTPIFQEYARCFKGRKQLTYSPGLKKRYQEEEKTDEQIMEEVEHQALTLVELREEQWSAVLGNDLRGEVLEAARTGRPGAVLDVLSECGIPLYEEQYTRFEGWRVTTAAGAATIRRIRYNQKRDRWECFIWLDVAPIDQPKKYGQRCSLSEVTIIDGVMDAAANDERLAAA